MSCQTCIRTRSKQVIKPSMELNRHIIIDMPVTWVSGRHKMQLRIPEMVLR